MTDDTRQRIILYLKRHGKGSIAEMSRALDLTSVTIRHHVDVLRENGLVGKPSSRKKPGPGRPELVYSLTSEADEFLPRNYAELSVQLMDVISHAKVRMKTAELYRTIGSNLGQQAMAEYDPNPEKCAVEFMEERGYFPLCVRDEHGLDVRLANCPYLELAQEHPVTCLLDQAMIESIFGARVTMKGRIIQGKPVCTFRIQEDRPIDSSGEG